MNIKIIMTNLQNFKIRRQGKRTRYYVDNELLKCRGKTLKPHGIAIYNVLAKYSNSKTQSCFPSYETIMVESGVGRRNTVTKYLNLMERLNIIYIERSAGKKTNKYYLLDCNEWRINGISKATVKDSGNNLISILNDFEQYPFGITNDSSKAQDSAQIDTLNHISKSDNIKSNKENLSTFSKEKVERASLARKSLTDQISSATASLSLLKDYYKEKDIVLAIQRLTETGKKTKGISYKQAIEALRKEGVVPIQDLPSWIK